MTSKEFAKSGIARRFVLQDSVTVERDLPIVQAQPVNCLYAACAGLESEHADISVECSLFRVEDMSILFGAASNVRPLRVFFLKLVNPDGSQALFRRVDKEGASVELDEFDTLVVDSIFKNLRPAIGEAY